MSIVSATLGGETEVRATQSPGLPGRRRPGSRGTAEISGDCYEFADFRLFPRQRMLLLDGDRIDIGGRAFDLLLLLVSRAGKVVSLRDLMQAVWPNVTVDEANLRVQVCVVRRILSKCETAKRAIDNISLRGYCFVLPVRHHRSGPSVPEFEPRCRLPLLPDSVIGRDDAVQNILTTLQGRRLVTITGPAGIGKTTVATVVAKRYSAGFSGFVCFVDLSAVCAGSTPAHAIAKSLELSPSEGATEALCDHLRCRESLLILDTCEHIVDLVADLAETLLSRCPNLKLIVTSRQILRATGEWTFRLPSLTFPTKTAKIDQADAARFSALALFVDRIQSATSLELSGDDLRLVAEICRRLDGIPLALELAAARVTDLGLGQIAAHLNNCFAILTRGRRTALPRHRTLTAALDWCYSRLPEEEQAMLSHLAVLGGTFTAAQAVSDCIDRRCRRSPEALYGLYEKSLVTAELTGHEPLFRLLDTTRIYVLEKKAALRSQDRAAVSHSSARSRGTR